MATQVREWGPALVILVSGRKREGMVASPNNITEKVRELESQLYIATKRNGERRFHALYDRIWRSDVLLEAWERYIILEACMPHEKTIDKPCAGNPHVRFERGALETELARDRARGLPMEEKPRRSWLTVCVTAIVLAIPLYVASVGPLALAAQYFEPLNCLEVFYVPLRALDNATDHKYIEPYIEWWVDLMP